MAELDPNPKLRWICAEAAMANLGKRVRITYVEWLLMPYSVGSSGYEVVSIEPVPAAVAAR